MSNTPLFDALVNKVRDWSNKREVNTLPDSVIQDCLKYSADDCYKLLRIPPFETTVTYTVDASNNLTSGDYTEIEIPANLSEFIYLREVSDQTFDSPVFNQVTDARTFLDPYARKYSAYNWMWLDNKIKISPQMDPGATIEIAYYRRLPDLFATYIVIPVNYIISIPDADQPYLKLVTEGGTNLYFSTKDGITRVFSTFEEASEYNVFVTTKMYVGREAPNWLRDSNERLLIWGALKYVALYIVDEAMEAKYEKAFLSTIDMLNREEKFRRAKGGNVQMNVNTNNLI
jgi:hypothetical protein